MSGSGDEEGLGDLGDDKSTDSPDKTKDDGTLDIGEPDYDYSDTEGSEGGSGTSFDSGTSEPESFDMGDSTWGDDGLGDVGTGDIDPETDSGVDEEEVEQESSRIGLGAIKGIKDKVWNRENIPSMPSLPGREDLPGGSITGWRPDFMRQAEEQAGEDAAQVDDEAAQEDPETSIDEDDSVDDPEAEVEEMADDDPELPNVTLEAPDQSDVAPLEDTFREEREFLRHSKSAQDFESAMDRALTSLAEGNKGVIQRGREINQNLDRLVSQLEGEVAQHNPEEVESWIMRWNRVKGYIEFVSSASVAQTNKMALEKSVLNGENSFNADGSNFLKQYKGLNTNSYGLKQVSSDLESILQGHLRPIAGSIDQSYSQEENLLQNLVDQLVKSQKIYSKMMILRMNLDVIEKEQGDYVQLISEIEGGAIRNKTLRNNAKSEIQKIQDGEMELSQIAAIEESILENMFEANKLLKRQYELTSHEFESLYESGEGRKGIEEDLRNFVESLGLDNSSEVYEEFDQIKSHMREVAELSRRITVERADQLEWYIKVSKMISTLVSSEKQYYESAAQEEDSYEEEVDEAVGQAEQREVPELDELESGFLDAVDKYLRIDGQDLTSELNEVKSELEEVLDQTNTEEKQIEEIGSDIKQFQKILDDIEDQVKSFKNGDISEKEFKQKFVHGEGRRGVEELASKMSEVNGYLESIEEEESTIKQEHKALMQRFKYLNKQLEKLESIRKELLQIHKKAENEGIETDLAERVEDSHSEIEGYEKFISSIMGRGGIQGMIQENKKLLNKESGLEKEELKLLSDLADRMHTMDTPKQDFVRSLSEEEQKKMEKVYDQLERLGSELDRVKQVKKKELDMDEEELSEI